MPMLNEQSIDQIKEYLRTFIHQFGKVLQACAVIFLFGIILNVLIPRLSCTNPTGATVTVICFVVTLTFILAEDNRRWEGYDWSQLSTYLLMLFICYALYMILADAFYEQVSTYCWGSLIPMPVTVIREKPPRDSFSSVVFLFFEYLMIVYTLVAFLAVTKITLMVVRFVAERGITKESPVDAADAFQHGPSSVHV